VLHASQLIGHAARLLDFILYLYAYLYSVYNYIINKHERRVTTNLVRVRHFKRLYVLCA